MGAGFAAALDKLASEAREGCPPADLAAYVVATDDDTVSEENLLPDADLWPTPAMESAGRGGWDARQFGASRAAQSARLAYARTAYGDHSGVGVCSERYGPPLHCSSSERWSVFAE